MVNTLFVQCSNCGQTIDRLSHLTPGFYHKISCPHCRAVTIVDVLADGSVELRPIEEQSILEESLVEEEMH